MRYATLEYRTKPDGPRRIDRFEFRTDGDYTGALPVGSEVVNVWVPTKRSPDSGD